MSQIYYTTWKEIDRYACSLERARIDVLNGISELTYRGQDIYILKKGYFQDTGLPAMYVGKTTRGIWWRLQQHMKDSSLIGKALLRDRGLWVSWTLEVIRVDKNLDFAERYYIEKYQPVYNKVFNQYTEPDAADLIEC